MNLEGVHRSGVLGVRGSHLGEGRLSSRGSHVAWMFSSQSRFEVRRC